MNHFERMPSSPESRSGPPLHWDSSVRMELHKEEDQALKMDAQGVWAVFDGVGGYSNGQLASDTAARCCYLQYNNKQEPGTNIIAELGAMRRWISEADRQIKAIDGYTTAVAVRLVKQDDTLYAVWANVGDSRLYLLRNNRLRQISKDEGEGRTLGNALGTGKAKIKQLGRFELQANDRLMLCSDGITGDYGNDILTESELTDALQQPTADEAAQQLIEVSRKRDDKSVIVIDIKEQTSDFAGYHNEQDNDTRREHYLGHDEGLVLDPSLVMEKREGYNILAQILAGDKTLFVLKLTSKENLPPRLNNEYKDVDFILVDETFFDNNGNPRDLMHGHIGLDAYRIIGRNDGNVFELSNTVSRNHFIIGYDKRSGIIVKNLKPTNKTIVVARQ